ncbi:MAG: hypothetical protein ICV68_09270, partial [Pyrinomonadaceae bacterium]|nr:hypothetical protein [Pyrinomonadaceae bacterium]
MLRIRTSALVLLLSVGMQGMGAGGCGTKRDASQISNTGNANTTVQPTPERVEKPVKDEIMVLAEGQYGAITDTFIVVARNVETYAALR